MIAVDTNILVYAHRRDSAWFRPAYACMQSLGCGTEGWLLPWPCVHEFLSIVTHPRIYGFPTTIDAAINQVDVWLESPCAVLAAESDLYWETLRPLLRVAKVSGGLIHDARIAAICLEHRVEALWTADRDFSRFRSLRTYNPLVTAP